MDNPENERIAALEAEVARLRGLVGEADRDAAAAAHERAVDDRRHARDLAATEAEIRSARSDAQIARSAAAASETANADLRAAHADLVASSAMMRSVLAASSDCIEVIDFEGRLVFMSEGGQRAMEIDDFEALRNRWWPDLWDGEGRALAERAIETAKAGGMSRFAGPAATAKGTPRYWDAVVAPIPGENGGPGRILSISRDITDIRRASEALTSSETTLRSVADAMPALIAYVDRAHVFRFANRAFELLLKRPRAEIVGRTVEELFDGDRLEKQMRPLHRGLAGEQVREQTRTTRSNGRVRWTDARIVPHRGPGGEILGVYALVIDVTELKQGEEQRRLLTRELAHRVKNTLATVAAIANQTLRPPASVEAAAEAFNGRLAALGQAHDLLTQSRWNGAPVRAVVEEALAPYGAGQGRFDCSGPDVELDSKRALSLTLAIHELATNAAKYGALSVDAGRVALSWSLEPGAGGERFRLNWRESGGPPVKTPSRRGFGSRLIERSLASDWGGEATIRYEPAGVLFELIAPAPGRRA